MRLLLTLILIFSTLAGSLETVGCCTPLSEESAVSKAVDASCPSFEIPCTPNKATQGATADHVGCHFGHCHHMVLVEGISTSLTSESIHSPHKIDSYKSISAKDLIRPPIA